MFKILVQSIIIISMSLFIVGCQENTNTRVMKLNGKNNFINQKHLTSKALKLNNQGNIEKIKSETKIQLEKIKSETKVQLEKIKSETKVQEILQKANENSQNNKYKKEKYIKEIESNEKLREQENLFKNYILLLLLSGLIIITLAIIYISYKKQKFQLAITTKKLENEKQIKEQEQKVLLMQQVLKTIESGKITPHMEQTLIATLSSEPKRIK